MAPLTDEVREAASDAVDPLREPAQDAAASVKDPATDAIANVKDQGAAAKDDVQGQVCDSTATVENSAAPPPGANFDETRGITAYVDGR